MNFNDNPQSLVEAFKVACCDGFAAALRVQATEKGSEVVSDQFASDGNTEPNVRVLSEVAEFLTEIRETVRQHTGDGAIALGRAVRLPDWAAEALGRVAVALVPLPLDIQLQVGAAVIRVASAFFEAEIASWDGRAKSEKTQREVLAGLAPELGTIAAFTEVRVPNVAVEAEVPQPEPWSKWAALTQRLGTTEGEVIAGLVEGEKRVVEAVAELFRQAPQDLQSPDIGIINPANPRHEAGAPTQQPAVRVGASPESPTAHATGVKKATPKSFKERQTKLALIFTSTRQPEIQQVKPEPERTPSICRTIGGP